jgi:hypothetical protein
MIQRWILAVLLAILGTNNAPVTAAPLRPMHPTFKFLDAKGEPVVRSGRAVSTMRTCGACHDTEYIADHCYHAEVGADDRVQPGQAASGREWDIGPGLFGRWDALTYGPHGPNLEVKQWIAWAGGRHIGGGPARSVGVELDCFLCHLPAPDRSARLGELRAGRYDWATTASLASTGVVKKTSDGWKWDAKAFASDGAFVGDVLRPRVSSSSNCGACHGFVHTAETPLVLPSGAWDLGLETKGQIFSAQRLKDSGLNLEGKDALSRSFDVHAERLLQCSSCHNTLNNPTFYSGVARNKPHHLLFEPRRLLPGEYLTQPNHNLAKGHTPQGNVARSLDGTMRRCEHCHDASAGHDWLPNLRQHLDALNCETCHVPHIYAPAREQTDWTLPTSNGDARVQYRGVHGDIRSSATLISGFQPIVLPRIEGNGARKWTPHNLLATWYWIAGDPPAPVDLALLTKAIFQDGEIHPEIKKVLDGNGDGIVEASEWRLDTPDKTAAVRARLEALGLHDPRIRGEIQPYSLHHGVAAGQWAVRQCAECHGPKSRLDASMELASYIPGGVLPKLVGDANVDWNGRLFRDNSGRLLYEPATPGLHVLGKDRWHVGDWIGLFTVLMVTLAVVVHGGLRMRAARKAR